MNQTRHSEALRNHPLRIELNDEVHARPTEPLLAPVRLSYLVLHSVGDRESEWRGVCELAERYGATPPASSANHYVAAMGEFRLKWERHAEFSRYQFIVDGVDGHESFSSPALDLVPEEWLSRLPGQLMVAIHAIIVDAGASEPDVGAIADEHFAGQVLLGSLVGDGGGIALTDFRIGPDGFSRLLIHNRSMSPLQAGRLVQRVLEIDTYRVMALLALPVARDLAPFLTRCEREVAEITTRLSSASEADEPGLLDRLTRLEAEIGTRESVTHYRFGAAAAYYELVQRRIAELREERIAGLQTFQEFTERRLAPAMNTCIATAHRQDSVSARVARTTRLLSTRVNITNERQNHALLESMNRRAGLQIRLQQTVEAFSVAAVTYYVVGIIAVAAEALLELGVPLRPELIAGFSIPLVLTLATLGVGAIRRRVARSSQQT